MARPADENERDVLEKFRAEVRDLLPPSHVQNDAYLLRWVRARDRDLDKALAMLKNSLAWRKEMDVDNIGLEPISQYYNSLFNCYFGGVDKCGRPVICVPIGEWDLREHLDKGLRDEIIRFLAIGLEIVNYTMQEMWRYEFPQKTMWQHTQFTVIIDLKGVTYGKLMHKKSLETILELTKIYEAHYPETLGAAVVINAPWIFSTVFAMIKPLLSELTVSKIAIFDSKEANWKKAVLKIVDEDEIPPRYGGSKISYNPL